MGQCSLRHPERARLPHWVTRVRSLSEAVDVADVLHLDEWVPRRSNAKLAAKPLIVHGLVAEHTRQDIVSYDLRLLGVHHVRSVTAFAWATALTPD